jgi:hypothetical protein
MDVGEWRDFAYRLDHNVPATSQYDPFSSAAHSTDGTFRFGSDCNRRIRTTGTPQKGG